MNRSIFRALLAGSLLLSVLVSTGAENAGERISFSTEDGVTIVGTYYSPSNGSAKVPAILLLHQLGRDRSTFEPLIPALLNEKYAVLALDLRGHGESTVKGEETISYKDFSDADFASMLKDVEAGVRFLKGRRGVRGDRIGVIGASIGANLALEYAAEDRAVRTVILLSPGLNYRGLETAPFLKPYDKRALFLVAAEGDAYSAQSSKKLKELATLASPCKLKLYEGKSHGTDILATEKGLSAIIVAWLQNHLPNG